MTRPFDRLVPVLATAMGMTPLAAIAAPQAPGHPAPKSAATAGDAPRFTRFGGWGGFGGFASFTGMSRTMLIMNPAVQEELKLTAEQRKSLADGNARLQEQAEVLRPSGATRPGEAAPSGAPGDVDPVPVDPEAMLETAMVLVSEGESGPAKILGRKQLARLDQIVLQMEGATALRRPEVAGAVGLDPGQSEAIGEIMSGSKRAMADLLMKQGQAMLDHGATPPGGPPAPAPPAGDGVVPEARPKGKADAEANRLRREADLLKLREGNDQIQDASTAKILKLLTKRQRDRFDKLLGAPFDPAKVIGPDGAPRPVDRAKVKDGPKDVRPGEREPK